MLVCLSALLQPGFFVSSAYHATGHSNETHIKLLLSSSRPVDNMMKQLWHTLTGKFYIVVASAKLTSITNAFGSN
jgi:acetolactate synthase regulatory subunit